MSKNKKRFLSVLLAFAMLCSIVSPAWADIPRSEEGYYARGENTHRTVYLESITIADHEALAVIEKEEFSEEQTKRFLRNHLDALGGYLDKDLNDGAGGNFIYLGWNGMADPNNAITGLRLLEGNKGEPPASYEEDGVTWNLVNQAVLIESSVTGVNVDPLGWHDIEDIIRDLIFWESTYSDEAVDLNDGAGGDYIYMYYTKDPSYGPPISEVKFTEDDDINLNSYQDKIVRFGDGEWYDVNDGAGGDYIYLYTETNFQAVNIAKLRELTEAAEECLNDSERYTDISALESAYKEGKATLEAWGDDKYYTKDTSMKEVVDFRIRTLEIALGNLVVNENVGSGNEGDHEGITKPEWPDFDNIDQETWNKWWSDSSQLWKQWADQYDWSDYADWSDKYNWSDWSDKYDHSDLSEWYHFYRK